MKIAIIGCGYVGLPSGVGYSDLGNDVVCVDSDEERIKKLNRGIIPIYEDGLKPLFKKHMKNGRLRFTTSIEDAAKGADVIIVAVGTPPRKTGEADLKYIFKVAAELAPFLKGQIVAIKSTVPVGTGDKVEDFIKAKNHEAKFCLVSLPEFLREGHAIGDFLSPDRIVVGTDNKVAQRVFKRVYGRLERRILFMPRRCSELVKYASNSFLAVKIHFINEMADLCEKTGTNIDDVAKGMGLDARIGPAFLKAGPGYGGSCFPKDTMALEQVAKRYSVKLSLVSAAIRGNERRKKTIAGFISNIVQTADSPRVAVVGLAFKEGTDDCRESPAIKIIQQLLKDGISVSVYDPKAMGTAKKILGDKVRYTDSVYNAALMADVFVVATEWPQFKRINFKKIRNFMRSNFVFDLRNITNLKAGENDCGLICLKVGA